MKESVNHTFLSKFIIAKHNEVLYRCRQISYDQAMEFYDEVRIVGAHRWEYWHAKATFLVEAGLEEAKKEYLFLLASKKAFIDTYTLWMDSAIQYAGEHADELELEKEKMLNIILRELEDIQEHAHDSSDPLILKSKLEFGPVDYYGCAIIISFFLFIILLTIATEAIFW